MANRRLYSRMIDELRTAQRPAPAAAGLDAVLGESAAEQAERRARAAHALRALATLGASDRRLVILAADGADGPALARAFTVTPATARQRLSRVRRRLATLADDEALVGMPG